MPALPKDLTISDKLIHFLKNEEGFRDKAYQDSGGVWTIGYGNTVMSAGQKVQPGMSLPKDQADVLLKQKAQEAESIVRKHIKVPLNQDQYEALVSFAYNTGGGGFLTQDKVTKKWHDTGVKQKINAGDFEGAKNEIGRWVYDDRGHPVLKNRRAKEIAYFSSGQDSSGGPSMVQPQKITQPIDTAGGPVIAEAPKKKVPLAGDSAGGMPTLGPEIALPPPNMMSMLAKAGQQSPLEAITSAPGAAANLLFTPAYAQSEEDISSPISSPAMPNLQQQQAPPLQINQPPQQVAPQIQQQPVVPLAQQIAQVPQQLPPQPEVQQSYNLGAQTQLGLQGLVRQPANAYNALTRLPNQLLIGAQDTLNLGNQDVDKSQYFTFPAVTPEDIVGRDDEYAQAHPYAAPLLRIGGDVPATLLVMKSVLSSPLPMPVKLGILGAYGILSDIGAQAGEKAERERDLAPNPDVATGGLPDLNPENWARAGISGLLWAGGEAAPAAIAAGWNVAKAAPSLIKAAPGNAFQLPGLFKNVFLDKLENQLLNPMQLAKAATTARLIEQGGLEVGRIGRLQNKTKGLIDYNESLYREAEGRLFYKEVSGERKELVQNLIKALHETDYLAKAGIAGGDSELIENILSKSLKEGADVGDSVIRRDLQDARVIDPMDPRFQKLTPDQILDLISYHAEKYGLSSNLARDAMSDIRVLGFKLKHLEDMDKSLSSFLPSTTKASFLDTLSPYQRRILGEPIAKKFAGGATEAFSASAERETGIDAINRLLKVGGIQKARDSLVKLARKTRLGLDSMLDNFPINPASDDWSKAVLGLRDQGENFLQQSLGKKLGPEDLQALQSLKNDFHGAIDEVNAKFPGRWNPEEVNAIKTKVDTLEKELYKRQDLRGTSTKGREEAERIAIKETKKINTEMIKDLQK